MHDIKISNLSFAYDKNENLVLENIDIEIKAGELVCILGQSGCGKSTLLRLLGGLEQPIRGQILIEEEEVKQASLDRGIVFQDYGLFPWMSAGENIVLALKQRFPNQDKKELKQVALNMIREVGLEAEVYQKLPKELSGGMKQRCAIAQAFAINPPIMLMDEPFGALDAVTRAKLQDLVLKLWRQGEPQKTVIFVTHDVDEALLLANCILVLGQSPSKVLYECIIPSEKRPTRENQFDNPEILAVRNELISQINKDVANRIC